MAKSPIRNREPNLPDSELEVIRVLWKKESATARDVYNQLRNEGSKWTYATVNTLLQRLEAKGMATSDKSGISYVYSPKITKQKVIKKRVRDIVDKLYEGNGSSLVLHLLKSEQLSDNDMSEIRAALEGGPVHEES